MQRGKGYKGLKKTAKNKASSISGKVFRLLEIYTLIAQNSYPSIEFLKERYNVSDRTIFRYLNTIGMIDQVEYDNDRQGYHFLNNNRLKKIVLSDNQLMLLLAMGEATMHLGSPLKEEFAKFTEALTNITKTPTGNKTPILIKIPDAIDSVNIAEHFNAVSRCISEHRSIDFLYDSRHSGEKAERRVDPYGLAFYNGIWLMVGYCHLREELRHFTLDRITNLKETNLYFKPSGNFDLEAHFSKSWGVWDEKEVEVTVRFSKIVADLITRNQKWHPSEKRKILPSGEVELTFTVAGVDEIKHWIYTWIPNVEILEPKWLREKVQKELGMSSQKHA